MTDARTKILWHVLRVLVAAVLIAYVVSQATFRDSVRPAAPDEAALPILRESPAAVVVRAPDGTDHLIPREEFRPGGAVRIEGILSIAARLADRWGLVLAAVAAMIFQQPFCAVRWQLLLAVQGIRITFLESLRLTYIGAFFNNWMPGATGGDFVKAYYIARRTHRKAEAVTIVFLDRLVGLVAVGVMGAAAVIATLGDPDVRVARLVDTAFLGVVLLAGVLFYSRLARRLLLSARLFDKLTRWPLIARIDRALFIYRYHKRKVALSVLYSWCAQIAGVFAVWWLAAGLGSRAFWYHYFLIMPVIWIAWALIPVPGGFGVVETLMQKLFTAAVLGAAAVAAGAPAMPPAEAATLALAMILAYRLVQMVVSLPGGVLYLARRTGVSPAHMREEMEAESFDA